MALRRKLRGLHSTSLPQCHWMHLHFVFGFHFTLILGSFLLIKAIISPVFCNRTGDQTHTQCGTYIHSPPLELINYSTRVPLRRSLTLLPSLLANGFCLNGLIYSFFFYHTLVLFFSLSLSFCLSVFLSRVVYGTSFSSTPYPGTQVTLTFFYSHFTPHYITGADRLD